MFCPLCQREFNDRPAISRRDNKTYICPDCGLKEALEDIPEQLISADEKEEIYKIATS